MPETAGIGDAGIAHNEPILTSMGWSTTGSKIDYGISGIAVAIPILLGGAGLSILTRFLFSVLKAAHDDVAETDGGVKIDEVPLG